MGIFFAPFTFYSLRAQVQRLLYIKYHTSRETEQSFVDEGNSLKYLLCRYLYIFHILQLSPGLCKTLCICILMNQAKYLYHKNVAMLVKIFFIIN